MIIASNIKKTYANGFEALQTINLEIHRGEIFALLGPNGAGKTTLINIICGIVSATQGGVTISGFDYIKNYRQARALVGLVPQELATHSFETPWDTVSFTRGLFGKPADPAYVEKILRQLSLWDKKNEKIMNLSGGMKRRVMIAKALSHEPKVLFLDEPTAGVDVELRKGMWQVVRGLRDAGVTIILTTHYIEEAEEMADRIGVMNKGKLIVTEEKNTLMKKLGKKELRLDLSVPMEHLPESLKAHGLRLSADKSSILYAYNGALGDKALAELSMRLQKENIYYQDITTRQSSLEDIFVELVQAS